MKISKIEVLRIDSDDEPEVYFILPSGHEDVDIQVYESGYEELEIKFVASTKWKELKESLELNF